MVWKMVHLEKMVIVLHKNHVLSTKETVTLILIALVMMYNALMMVVMILLDLSLVLIVA